ncbi:hypothetical protein FB566_3370 [Stackebrandtia endophytica]|uniref:Uncharacterized protein n=1 Tax=Stackebrandtia endophytica TaxID=1496996 RepID=A0A543AZ07_9ACTN|nr:hypothetical protein [Stackebrandtia endophytica]TQL77803.1 hypothetical protein FB566_3370 [Stackebrandtia endophytica]
MFKRTAAVAGITAALMLSGCTGDGDDPTDPGSSAAPAELEIHPEAAEYLTVTESGFTVAPGEDGEFTVSYAIVLENANPDYAAYRVGVDVGWLDAAGEPIEVLPPEGGPVREHAVMWVAPGAVWVLADVVSVADEPTEFALGFSEEDSFNRWLAVDRLNEVGELTVTDADVFEPGDRDAASWWQAELTVDSGFGESLNGVNLAMVLRDADGAIVGGNRTYGAEQPTINYGENLVSLTTPEDLIPETADLQQSQYYAQLTWNTVWEPVVKSD